MIRRTASRVIGQFPTVAAVATADGASLDITCIRRDPPSRAEVADAAVTDVREVMLVLASEYESPARGDVVTFESGDVRRVGEVEPHRENGYWRIYLEE